MLVPKMKQGRNNNLQRVLPPKINITGHKWNSEEKITRR